MRFCLSLEIIFYARHSSSCVNCRPPSGGPLSLQQWENKPNFGERKLFGKTITYLDRYLQIFNNIRHTQIQAIAQLIFIVQTCLPHRAPSANQRRAKETDLSFHRNPQLSTTTCSPSIAPRPSSISTIHRHHGPERSSVGHAPASSTENPPIVPPHPNPD